MYTQRFMPDREISTSLHLSGGLLLEGRAHQARAVCPVPGSLPAQLPACSQPSLGSAGRLHAGGTPNVLRPC